MKPKENWITFIYVGNETRVITKLFKNNTNLGIAYKVNNTTEKNLYIREEQNKLDKYRVVFIK
jgi:RNase P/RNase MRP subunit p29